MNTDKKKQTDDIYDLMMCTLSQCGVDIRTVAGCRVLFLNNRSSLEQKKECCLNALRILNAEQAHLPPRIRQLLGEEDW